MDGGRKKWLAEARELSTDKPEIQPKTYRQGRRQFTARVPPEVQKAVSSKSHDARRCAQPAGVHRRDPAHPGLPETCQRGGHIPRREEHSWAKECNEDGTFKSVADLKALYGAQGITGDKPVIAYCRIGGAVRATRGSC